MIFLIACSFQIFYDVHVCHKWKKRQLWFTDTNLLLKEMYAQDLLDIY